MKIKRNSWHYQFITAMGLCPSNDLCGYIRQLVLFAPILFVAATATGLLFAFSLILPFAISWRAELIPLALLPFCAWWLVLYLAREYMHARFGKDTFLGRPLVKPTPPSETRLLLRAFFKSAKERICPFISFYG